MRNVICNSPYQIENYLTRGGGTQINDDAAIHEAYWLSVQLGDVGFAFLFDLMSFFTAVNFSLFTHSFDVFHSNFSNVDWSIFFLPIPYDTISSAHSRMNECYMCLQSLNRNYEKTKTNLISQSFVALLMLALTAALLLHYA